MILHTQPSSSLRQGWSLIQLPLHPTRTLCHVLTTSLISTATWLSSLSAAIRNRPIKTIALQKTSVDSFTWDRSSLFIPPRATNTLHLSSMSKTLDEIVDWMAMLSFTAFFLSVPSVISPCKFSLSLIMRYRILSPTSITPLQPPNSEFSFSHLAPLSAATRLLNFTLCKASSILLSALSASLFNLRTKLSWNASLSWTSLVRLANSAWAGGIIDSACLWRARFTDWLWKAFKSSKGSFLVSQGGASDSGSRPSITRTPLGMVSSLESVTNCWGRWHVQSGNDLRCATAMQREGKKRVAESDRGKYGGGMSRGRWLSS